MSGLPICNVLRSEEWRGNGDGGNVFVEELANPDGPRAADLIERLYEALTAAGNALQFEATRVTEHGSSPELRRKQRVLQEQADAAFAVLAKARGEAK